VKIVRISLGRIMGGPQLPLPLGLPISAAGL
jgi:hypothetical protein